MEVPWPLGPPDGRYLLRAADDPGPPGPGQRGADDPAQGAADGSAQAPTHVIVFATLGAAERRRLTSRRGRAAPPQPEPTPVSTSRVTVIDAQPGAAPDEVQDWLRRAGESELEQGLAVLNRALHAFRVVSADPYAHELGRSQLLVARIGYGAGEQVADGLWTEARELPPPSPSRRRAQALMPQARLAAVLGARQAVLASEELVLRARRDLDHQRPREAALQVLVALDAALAELGRDPHVANLADRLQELRGQREAVAAAAQAALGGPLSPAQHEAVSSTVQRLEAVLRARAALGG